MRQFTFFDVSTVKDVHDLASSPEIFKVCSAIAPPCMTIVFITVSPQKSPEISCIISTDFGVLVADIHGSVFLLNDDFETTKSWLAHNEGRVTHMVERNGILVTLGVSSSLFFMLKC